MVKSKTSKKSGEQDITWEHCTAIPGKDRGNVKCIYCGKEMTGGVYRMKHHLAGIGSDVKECKQISQDVRDMFVQLLTNKQVKNAANDCFNESTFEEDIVKGKGGMDKFVTRGKSDGQQLTINQMVKQREPVIRDICRFLYGHALAFNTVKGPLFIKMLKSVGEYGRGLKPPTYHEARVTYLKKEVEHVKGDLEVYKREWEKTGCTLMSDGWTDGKHRHLTNFLVNSPRGTVFLKSVDTSGIIKDSEALFKLLDGLVEEIGADNVVQVITDSASAYVGAGKMLEEKRPSLFWSPCAAHCLNLILSDIGDLPVFMDTIEKAKKVSSFIYRHPWLLDLFRKYTKKKELARPGVTRFATSFLTLKSMQDKKIQLRAMFASEEWAKSKYAPTQQGKEVQDILLQDARFWKAVVFCLHCAWPLVKVLRLVDGDSKPAMGYIYEAMDRAKEEIASNLKNETRRYEQIWNIIDARWDMQLHRPLHAAGFYLNPRYFYDPKYNVDREIKRGFCKVVDKMFPGLDSRVLIDEQMEKFKNAEGLFGESMAVLTRDKKQPGLWWESYGDDCNELRKLAMRVLNLTCSATGCERNWSTFDLIHSKRRNRLEQERLDALVFVKYNIQLELRQLKRQERGETYDPICLSDMESDDEWITEKEGPCLPIDHSWMDIQECFDVDEGVTSKKRKRGPRNLNAVKAKKSKEAKGKGKSMLIDEEEIEYISDDDEDEEEEEFPEMLMVDDDEDSDEFDPYDD